MFAALALGVSLRGSPARADNAEFIQVIHTFYLAPDGTMVDDEQSGTVSAQFVVNTHIWAAASMPVKVQYNGAGAPGGFDMTSLIQQDLAKWNAVSPSTFSFQWNGSSSANTGACGNPINADGVNTIAFAPLTAPTLARTCTLFPATGSSTKLVEFDMTIDDDANWSAAPDGQTSPSGTYDLVSTVLHELGHAAGLGHSNADTSVMYASIKSAQQKRALTSDDIAGLQSAYPGGGPAPTNTPTTPTNTPMSSPTQAPPPSISTNFRVRTLALARD
jgi:hypothetical protein